MLSVLGRCLFAKVKVKVWQNFMEDKKTTRAPGQQLHRGTWSWAEASRVPLVKRRVLFRKPMEAMTIEVALTHKWPILVEPPSPSSTASLAPSFLLPSFLSTAVGRPLPRAWCPLTGHGLRAGPTGFLVLCSPPLHSSL